METVLALMMGVGLSAACGFRVFVPLLGMSIAALAGHLELAPSFVWIGSWPALLVLATATILEIGAYYVPWLDNLLDSLATPAAIIAGTMVTAAMVVDLSPLLKWTLAVIAGGGAAGLIQAGTVVLRSGSSAASGGFTNFLVASGELLGSAVTTLLAMLVTPLAFVLVLLLCLWLAGRMLGLLRPSPPAAPAAGHE